MEPAIIDWKRLDSRFVKDELFEHINAPQWVDLDAPDQPADDESWFCRPDCNHPKTVEDFFKETPIFKRSISLTEVQSTGDRSPRKWKCYRFVEDSENCNPNKSTGSNSKASKFFKETIKSSAEKQNTSHLEKDEMPRLKSTLSAKHLFTGKDILNQLTEFCNELKRLATRAREGENLEKEDDVRKNLVEEETQKMMDMDCKHSEDFNGGEKERKPLLVVNQQTPEAVEKCNIQKKQRRKRRDDEAENIPMSVDLKNIIKSKGQHDNVLQIRTCPPSPQCFSGTQQPAKAPLTKTFRSRPMGRGILEELQQSNKEVKNEDSKDKNVQGRQNVTVVAEREARTLDIFWFLKPCTLSS